jgi:hypothetical protein
VPLWLQSPDRPTSVPVVASIQAKGMPSFHV